jgi:soluble lytic murein transglycosylase
MIKIVVSLLLLLPMAGNSAIQSSAGHHLHTALFKELDAKDYEEAAVLLKRMKQEHPSHYSGLPYSLLHARTLLLAKKPREAFAMYEGLIGDKRLAPYALLPAARIAAEQKVPNSAVYYYQQYLRNAYPEYISVAREALEYAWQLKKADLLYETAKVVKDRSTLDRLAELYLGRAYVLRGDSSLARSTFLTLIAYRKKDDITNLALTELDLLEGNAISAAEKQRRGRLAFDVWNFELARKYLEPVATQNMEAGYYYARTLFFLGDHENSRKSFQVALGLWPDDPKYEDTLYQYANVFLREGNYEKASELYGQLKNIATGEMKDKAAFKMIYALRAQNRLEEALKALEPYTRSRNLTQKGQALLLRSRIHFQMDRFRDALAGLEQTLTLKPFRNHKEVLLWKGMTLEKLNRSTEARNLFVTLAKGEDYYSYKAQERITGAPVQAVSGKNQHPVRLPQLPDASHEELILSEYASGNVMPAFLYLRLYEEAAQLLPEIDQETWRILGVDSADRLERFLAIAYLGALGDNYSTATYYSELFLKNFPRTVSIFALSPEVLRTLFPIPYQKEVEQFSRERKLDPFLVLSIMKQESKFKRLARSQAFARGLMQIIPSTASSLALALGMEDFSVEQLYVPEVNINLGTRYVQDITKEFGNEVEFIAAGYNGGESNVRRWLASSIKNEVMDFVSSIDFKETKNYVMIVKTNYELYKRIYDQQSASGRTENSSTR